MQFTFLQGGGLYSVFHCIDPLGQFSLRVAMSVCLYVCVRHWMHFLRPQNKEKKNGPVCPFLSVLVSGANHLFTRLESLALSQNGF